MATFQERMQWYEGDFRMVLDYDDLIDEFTDRGLDVAHAMLLSFVLVETFDSLPKE